MARAQCPSCSRWLSLPDSVQGQQVQCPLCQKVFVAPRARHDSPMPPHEAPDPARPWRPSGPDSRDPDLPLDLPRLPQTSHRAPVSRPLGLLANWLFGLSLMSFMWNASCGCGGLLSLGTLLPKANELILLLGFLLYFVPLVVYLVVMITSQTLYSATRNRNVFWFGIGLAQLEYLFGTVRLVLLIQALFDRGQTEVVVYLNAVSLVLSAGLIITTALIWRRLLQEKPPPGESDKPDPDED